MISTSVSKDGTIRLNTINSANKNTATSLNLIFFFDLQIFDNAELLWNFSQTLVPALLNLPQWVKLYIIYYGYTNFIFFAYYGFLLTI